ncbi:unnamed protein product, partial [Owenia fusiformis]
MVKAGLFAVLCFVITVSAQESEPCEFGKVPICIANFTLTVNEATGAGIIDSILGNDYIDICSERANVVQCVIRHTVGCMEDMKEQALDSLAAALSLLEDTCSEHTINDLLCKNVQCENGGMCILEEYTINGDDTFLRQYLYYKNKGIKCQCPLGFKGNFCEKEDVTVVATTSTSARGSSCMSNPCYGGATCVDLPGDESTSGAESGEGESISGSGTTSGSVSGSGSGDNSGNGSGFNSGSGSS